MKEYLMEKVAEFAIRIGIDEEAIYKNDFLYGVATLYAERKLKEGKQNGN